MRPRDTGVEQRIAGAEGITANYRGAVVRDIECTYDSFGDPSHIAIEFEDGRILELRASKGYGKARIDIDG